MPNRKHEELKYAQKKTIILGNLARMNRHSSQTVLARIAQDSSVKKWRGLQRNGVFKNLDETGQTERFSVMSTV